MKGIMSGLEPVKMKTGGDPEEKSMMEREQPNQSHQIHVTLVC